MFGCLPVYTAVRIKHRSQWTIVSQLANPLAIVITPLNLLIADQIEECTNLGIKYCKKKTLLITVSQLCIVVATQPMT